MDYQRHYDALITRARNRVLEGYVERHHVVPRCMGGGDERENIVALTPEEHYLAHQLLVKLYPSVKGLAYAAIAMCGKGRTKNRNNKAYGWIRRAVGAAKKGSPSPWKGKTFTAEQLKKISVGRTGKGQHSPEWKAAHVERMKGNQFNTGRVWSKEVVAARAAANSLAQKGKTLTADHKESLKIAAANPLSQARKKIGLALHYARKHGVPFSELTL